MCQPSSCYEGRSRRPATNYIHTTTTVLLFNTAATTTTTTTVLLLPPPQLPVLLILLPPILLPFLLLIHAYTVILLQSTTCYMFSLVLETVYPQAADSVGLEFPRGVALSQSRKAVFTFHAIICVSRAVRRLLTSLPNPPCTRNIPSVAWNHIAHPSCCCCLLYTSPSPRDS